MADQSRSIEDANLQWIRAYHPHLLSTISEANEDAPEEVYDTIDLFFDDEELAQNPPRYVVFYGMGQGECLRRFYQEHKEHLFRFILIEPNPAHFTAHMQKYLYFSMLQEERVEWIVGEDHERLCRQLTQDYSELGIWGLKLFIHTYAREKAPVHYTAVQEQIKAITHSAWENMRLLHERGLLIQHNIVRNLSAIAQSFTLDSFYQRLSPFPAVVVGAGPSLDKNIHLLKHLPANFLLIATDTCLPALLQREIQPHVVMSCDPLKMNARHFDPVFQLGSILLAYLPEVNYQILEKYPQHTLRLCLHSSQSKTLQAFLPYLQGKTMFPRRTNAGHCALWLAQQMGCSPIVLVGMDLAIPKEGSSHALEAQNRSQVTVDEPSQRARIHGAVEIQENPMVQVPGYYGGKVYTFPHFADTLRKMEQEIAGYGLKVINATEGGAEIRGAEAMPLEEALRIYQSNELIQGRWQELLTQPPMPPVREMVQKLESMSHTLEKRRRQSELGRQKIKQTMDALQKQSLPLNQGKEYLLTLVQRWKALLHDPGLDLTMDTALSRWRIDTQRIHWDKDITEPAALFQPFGRLEKMLEGLEKDIQLFQQIYAQRSQTWKNDLTSTPPE